MSAAASIRFRLLVSVLSLLLAGAILAAGGLWWLIRRSLPQLDDAAALPGLSAVVTVERDAAGVPAIHGATRLDVARALGYLHAQDRFFQMDLLRRRSAGELAELFGQAAVPVDREARIHGFRTLARSALALLPAAQRELVDTYTAGVNAGLAALRARPFEYYLLRVRPQPWRPEDTLLVGYSMVLDLQDSRDRYEQMLAAIQYSYGRTMLDFVAPAGTEFDAALDGGTFPQPPVPGPEIIDLRKRKADTGAEIRERFRLARRPPRDDEFAPGSNVFALAGSRTANGSALLANDMHLHLGVPNVWYRAELEWENEVSSSKFQGPSSESRTPAPDSKIQSSDLEAPPAARPTKHRVTGVTLPGIPLVVAGSNGRIAWGFTNSYADTADIVIVEASSIDPLLYKNGVDLPQVEQRQEIIRVKGGDPVALTTRWTIWGPIIGDSDRARSLALHWVFHDPAALNLNLLELETAPDAATALALAPHFGLPAQNIIVADRDGAIGWTITGLLPRRVGFDGRLPAIWGYGDRTWNGYLPADEYPRVLSPPAGQLWSANNRPVSGASYLKLGDGGYDTAARARQIRDDLTALTTPATARDLLAIQLDDRAVLLERWQKLLLATLRPDAVAAHPHRAELRRLVSQWNGQASIDSVAYTLVRRWRESVAGRVLNPVFEPCLEQDESFDFRRLDYEAPLWQMVQQRPPNFLTPDNLTWDDLLLKAADDVLQWADHQSRPLPRLTWGGRNTTRIQHPFSRFLPDVLARLLDMPAVPLPGDRDMPRVQGPSFGASERFVVSPGHEEDGIFHMPGGQSGHPLSPYYRAGYDAWAQGKPAPFLPGPPQHTLRLQPSLNPGVSQPSR
jgi:penicillin amidase